MPRSWISLTRQSFISTCIETDTYGIRYLLLRLINFTRFVIINVPNQLIFFTSFARIGKRETNMDGKILISEQVVTGWFLILSFIIFVPGGLLYTGRAIWKWPAAQSQSYLYWERCFVMAAILVAALGLVLLERLLEAAGDKILSPVGLTIFLIGTVLVLVAETFSLGRQEMNYAAIIVFVVLAFLGEAIFGAAILRTGLLPGWVGWATIIWNLVWLVILPLARPQNMYYPWLHYAAPLTIGIMLLVGR